MGYEIFETGAAALLAHSFVVLRPTYVHHSFAAAQVFVRLGIFDLFSNTKL